jgi:hypothetical protein
MMNGELSRHLREYPAQRIGQGIFQGEKKNFNQEDFYVTT